ncbi:hypothetical protein GCM10009530_48460 [Microbispora corallina]|uniref:Uncharacterized protein n=1 Tax=Microbispora corallina TaxID=83302 RepID=A0ABQ4G5Q9_9ACTN|nr:hypothetical protein Mco01_54220 [Microbispora corallina]
MDIVIPATRCRETPLVSLDRVPMPLNETDTFVIDRLDAMTAFELPYADDTANTFAAPGRRRQEGPRR